MEKRISGQIADVVSGEIFPGTIVIKEGLIAEVIKEKVEEKQFIIPGFVDAHIHVESSMLIPSEFCRLAVRHGTVATISDPHEIANVLGIEGVKFMIENGKKTPFKFYFGAPSCVPATKFETAGAEIDSSGIEELMNMPEIHYLAEMMNFPGVLQNDAEVMKKIQIAHALNKPVDGHAPGLRGSDAEKYIKAGISTDHECFTLEEALDKLKFGMIIIIREGSAAKNFNALIPLLDQYPDMIMFCSDDSHPDTLLAGHMNKLASRAVKFGCNIMNVLRAFSLNPIEHYNMQVGMLQVNDPADFCIVNDLQNFQVSSTYINGELVFNEGQTNIKSILEKVPNFFNTEEIQPNDIEVKQDGIEIKVISVEDGQLITGTEICSSKIENGLIVSDVENDVLKLVVVNRYKKALPAVAFVKNFGFNHGAIASSVAHDSHNIIAVGVSDHDICEAINMVIAAHGGVSLHSSEYQDILKLPVAGLMTNSDAFECAEKYTNIDAYARKLGTRLKAPYMTLSFCALLVIPKLKLSDLGLFDGNKFCFTSIFEVNSET